MQEHNAEKIQDQQPFPDSGAIMKSETSKKQNKSRMKKIILIIIGITFLFPSCVVHNGLSTNLNNHTTEVVLSKKNFKVIASVQGKARATYVFGIGGLSKKALIAEARANMLSKANIVGGSKAIINETVEIKQSLFPIVRLFKVTISGHIVEFTE